MGLVWCLCWAVAMGAAHSDVRSQWVPEWHPRSRRHTAGGALRGPGVVDSAVLPRIAIAHHHAAHQPLLPQAASRTPAAGRLWRWDVNPSRDNPAGAASSASRMGGVLYSEQMLTVASAAVHTLALDTHGRLWSWGVEEHSETPDGGLYGRARQADRTRAELGRPVSFAPPFFTHGRREWENPREVSGLPTQGMVGVAAGRYHSLAVDSNGGVWSWGMDVWGQLGRGGETLAEAEAAPPPPPPPGGYDEAQALLASFECSRRFRHCEAAAPGAVAFGGNRTAGVVAVAAGRYASAAVTVEGTVWGWGLLACGRPEGTASHRPWTMEGLDGIRVRVPPVQPLLAPSSGWSTHDSHAQRLPHRLNLQRSPGLRSH
jgi:hypothetical protein